MSTPLPPGTSSPGVVSPSGEGEPDPPAEDLVEPARGRTRRGGELVVATLSVALGVFVLLDARTITVPGSAGTLGPRAFPYLVGALLLLAGALVLVGVLRGRLGEEEGGEDVDPTARTDWRTVVLLAAVFLAHVYTINLVGWPFAATLLFAGSAVVLGARPWWRAVVAGLVLAFVLQVVFGGMLGLSLPPGPFLEGVSFLRG